MIPVRIDSDVITFLTNSGIILLCGLFALLFRPLEPTLVTENTIELEDAEKRVPKVVEKKYAYSVPTSAHTTWMKHQHYVYPKAVDVFADRANELTIEMKELQPLRENEDDEVDERPRKSQSAVHSARVTRRNTITDKDARPSASARGSIHLRREDSFLFGSLAKLPKYNSHSSIGYHVSVTHLQDPTDEQVRI